MTSLRSLLPILVTSAWSTAQDVSSIAQRVDAHYNHLASMRASFVETYRGAGISRSEAGTLLLKKPGRMRWDYSTPQPKLFVSDGKTAYFYVPGEGQARKTSVKKLDDLRSPLRLLLGKAQLQKEFKNLRALGSSNGIQLLEGVPKGMEQRVASVKLSIDAQDRIQAIEIAELDGSTTRFEFSQIAENVEIPEQQFRFIPPKGVNLIESSDVGP